MSVLGRLLLALLAFGGTSTALLIVTSQVAPGWRPAGIEPPLDPQPVDPIANQQAFQVEQISAEITVGAGANLPAWILKPRVARAMPGQFPE